MAEVTASKTAPDKGNMPAQERLQERPSGAAPAGPTANILALHDQAGNQAVNELLRNGNGRPLDASVRAFMESRFNHDFSQVRVHTDAAAAQSAEVVNARAYTVGSNIIFGPGEYVSETPNGQQLLSHELTHVIQQSDTAGKQIRPINDGQSENLEREARFNAISSVLSGSTAKLTINSRLPAPALQRQPKEPDRPQTGTASTRDIYKETKQDNAPLVVASPRGDQIIHLAKKTLVHILGEETDRVATWNKLRVISGSKAGQIGKIQSQYLVEPEKSPQVVELGQLPNVPSATREKDPLPTGHDYRQDPEYIDNIQHASYDVLSGDFWLAYPDGAHLRMNYQRLKKTIESPTSKEEEKKRQAIAEEAAKKHGITLPKGSQSTTVTVYQYWRVRATGKIVPNEFSEKTTPNIADAIQQIEEVRSDAELMAQLGQKILEIPIIGPSSRAPGFKPARPKGSLADRLRQRSPKGTPPKQAPAKPVVPSPPTGKATPAKPKPVKPQRGQQRPKLPRGAKAARAPINKFKEPFKDPQMLKQQQEIMELAKSNPQVAGNRYQNLVARDIQGGTQIQEKFRRPGRRMDIGTEHEVTIEGMAKEFSSSKLDQLWDDLVDKKNVTLTVPRLSNAAWDQLQRLLAQARQNIGPNVLIVVRETLP